MAPLVVFAMALFVTAATTTAVAHVQEEVQAATLVQKVWPLTDAYKGFKVLEQGARNYLAAAVDANGYLVYPGDGVPVMAALSPAYGFIPQSSPGYAWSVTTGTYNGVPSLAVCLQATTVSEQAVRFLQEVRPRLEPGNLTLGSACGAQVDAVSGVALTLWVPAKASLPPLPPDTVTTPDSAPVTTGDGAPTVNQGKGGHHGNGGNSAIHSNAGGASASHANSNAPGQDTRECPGCEQ